MNEKIINEYNELCLFLNYHNNLYFNLNNPKISDKEFDEKFQNLIKLEKEYPELISPASPSQRIGSEPISDFKKVEHSSPMMSIEKVFNHKDLLFNLNRMINTPEKNADVRFTCEYKIDGLALSLFYDNRGFLYRALTRGDGKVGEDVTHNAKVIQSIPLKLNGINKPIEIRGEVYMSFKVFQELNKNKKEKNEQLLANPRNAAAGALKRKDSKISKQSKLNFIAYDVVEPLNYGINTQMSILSFLKDFNFEVPKYEIINTENYDIILEKMENNKLSLEYPIDGLVIKIDYIPYRNLFDSTSSYPKWMMAYKFSEELAETEVKDIIVQVGKTGVLTPVAIFEPTELCGSIIRKASLHNYDIVDSLDIRIGDTVSIKKAGEIIPQVVAVISKGEDRGSKVSRPTNCPVCNSETKYEGENIALICSGYNCPAKLSGKLEYWASKEVMNIDGLGPAIVEQLMENDLVKTSFLEIYDIKLHELEQLERMGKKSSSKLYNAIQESKNRPFERVLCGMQIPQIGRTNSKILVQKFKNIYNLMNASIEDLLTIEGIGDISSKVIYDWFRNSENIKIVDKIRTIGFKLELEENLNMNQSSNKNGKFYGEIVCVTGTLMTGTRQEVHSNIVREGGEISDSITKKTTILVVGEKSGSKLEKAKKLGIRIMPEYEYANLLGL